MRLGILLLALFLPASAMADSPTDALLSALSIKDVAAAMRDEGIDYGKQLEEDMFPGSGGATWTARVSEIYSVDRFMPVFRDSFDATLASQAADIPAMTAFFSTGAGKKAVALEVSARRAMLDDGVEDASKLKVEDMRADKDPRLDLITDFIETNDLIEANVMGGLNASLAFYQGLADGGAAPEGVDDDALLQEVWTQEDGIRADTTEWLYAYLTLAYAPLSDDELRQYIDFSKSEPGRDLNQALFAGFDAVFVDVSRQLGEAAATHVAGQDL